MSVNRPRDHSAAIRDGVLRHVAGKNRAASRRASKAAAKPAAVAEPAPVADVKKPMAITDTVLMRARTMSHKLDRKRAPANENPFAPYNPPPGVLPKGTKPIAMDEALDGSFSAIGAWAAGGELGALFEEGIGFLGYAYLAQLTQRPEYRRISERIATEMTRKWIKLQVVSAVTEDTDEPIAQVDQEQDGDAPPSASPPVDGGEGPETAASTAAEQAQAERDRVRESIAKKTSAKKAKRVKELEDELRRLKVKDHFYNIAEGDGWFGRYHLYADLKKVDVDTPEGRAELKTSIGNGRNPTSRTKVRKGQLQGFRCVEPMWCYPATYDAMNPLKGSFYNPTTWYVNGIETHGSRLLTFVGREVPDILKPAYAFGGLSMSQMAKPYVDNWLRTRQAVADLIESFSVSGVYTNMQGTIQDGGDQAMRRIELFNTMRSNAGAFALDKESEEFFNVSTPLGTLDALQAQSQEQMSSVSGIPLIILLGITPTGLNASSEGEIRAFYDWIHAFQESFFRDHLETVIHFVMLSLWGEIDDEITFVFEPLWSMTDKEVAEIEKLEAETDQVRIDSGVLDPGEVRKALAAQPESRYADINPEDVPEPPEQPGMGDEPSDGGDDEGGDAGGSKADAPFGAHDEWNESDHPRADDGKFGQGGSGHSQQPSKSGKGESTSASAKPSQQVKSPHHGPKKGPFEQVGRANLKDQGFKPRKRGVGNDLTQVAQVAWSHAIDTGKSQTLMPNTGKNSWSFKTDKADMPYGSPHIVVDPDGTVTSYKPDLKMDLSEFDKDQVSTKTESPAAGQESGKPLKMSSLSKQGGKLGSNEGGVYTDDKGQKFYVKKPATKAHVENEKAAARLYQLAGVNTLKYRDVEGGGHVATEWQELDKNNIAKFTPAERKEAAKDFAVHAWLSNWDAAGLGGDNQGILGGKPTTLDVGGSLRYRAQGGPKGGAFGDKVTELDTLRDKSMNPDAAGLFGSMSDAEIKSSIERVTSIPDAKIRAAVGDDNELADRLIARKKNMAQRFGIAQDSDPDEAMMAVALDADEFEHNTDSDGSWIETDGEPDEVADGVFVMAHDEQQFDESKHKRDAGGKFSSTGGGGGGAKEDGKSAAVASMFKTKKEHIAHLLTKGTTPKELMQTMGWPSVSMPAQAKLLGMKLSVETIDGKKVYKGTPLTDEEKAAAKAAPKEPKKESTPKKAEPESTPDIPKGPEPGKPPKDYSEFLGAVAEAAKAKDVYSISGLFKFNPEWAQQFADMATPDGKTVLEKLVPGILPAKTPPKPKLPKATPEQLKKAEKNTTVPLSSSTPDAVSAIKAFNEKYAGKTGLSEEQLQQKIADYADMQAAVKKADADVAKANAEAAKEKAAKAAEEKKLIDAKIAEQVAKKKAELEAQFAADPELKTHYEAMQALFGGSSATEQFLQYAASKVKKAGLSKVLSAAEAVPIIAYSGSHYGAVNEQLRKGTMSVTQFKFMKSLNSALDKLPAHKETTYRKADLTPEQFAAYVPGHVVEERGFTSTSKNQGTWSGAYNFTVHGKSGRDIQDLSSHPSEAEVLFKSGTRFHVVSVKGSHVTLEEV